MTLEQLRAAVRRIPRGKVATYGDVAKAAGFPGAARQVVWALQKAGATLPWHRVVGAGGRIRLPGEAGFEQRARLASEGVKFQGEKIPMKQFAFDFRRRKASPAKASRTPG
jgi:methylated-DNA-protein-cysteine methyltransferase-like protein